MAKAKPKPKSPFAGRWRIVSMSAWDEDFIDEEEEGFFEFNDRGWGDFHVGNVQGHMDCRQTTREGEPAAEWTWGGNDGMDPAQGGAEGRRTARADLLPQRETVPASWR